MGLSKTTEFFSSKIFNKEVVLEMEDFRSSSMNEITIRFPVLFQAILKELDNKSLKKCRKVSKEWQNFIDNERFVLFRKMQKYHSSMEEFYEQWKAVTQNASKETIKELSAAVHGFFEAKPSFYSFHPRRKKKKEEQWSPLHITAEQGHLDLSKYIIEKTGEKNPKNSKEDTALQMAAGRGQLEVSKLIIENLEDKNPIGYDGWTALHFAAVEGHLEVCKLINESIEDGATIANSIHIHSGETPVDSAAVEGHLEVFRLLTETLENKNQTPYAHNWTPLHQAASTGRLELCRYIIDSGADKRPIGNSSIRGSIYLGYTPLAIAAAEGHLLTCKLFIDEWADLIQFSKGILFTKNWMVLLYTALFCVFLFEIFILVPFMIL